MISFFNKKLIFSSDISFFNSLPWFFYYFFLMIKFRFKIKFYVEKKYSSILIFIALELIWFSIFCFILGKNLYFTHETARFLDLISQYNNFIHNNWIKSCPKQQQKKEVFSFWSLHPGDAWPTIIRPCRITQTAQSNWKTHFSCYPFFI